MAQIQLQHIRKEYGDTTVLADINLTVSNGERIGIVGANGCGKSTLFRILTGEEQPDSGTIYISKKAAIKMLEQDHFADERMRTATQEAIVTDGEILRDESMFQQMMNLPKEKKKEIEVLSGGERTKLNLSRVLADRANVLLLDEPTNNLDYGGVQTFLYLISEFRGTLLIVSHDRYVLDQTVDKIVEIENGKAVVYEGNYTFYREEKRRKYEEQMHRYESDKKQQKQIENAIQNLKNWSGKAHRDSTKEDPSGLKFGIKEFHRAKAKKMDNQVKSGVKRLEKMRKEGEQRPEDEKTVKFAIENSGKSGRCVLEAQGLFKALGVQVLFRDSDFFISRGEKIVLTGPNGCGKSTFIHILEGKEDADSGSLWISPGSRPYVLSQTFQDLPADKTAYAYLEETVGQLKGLERTILNNMGISKRHLFQQIGSLSFGEQMKIKLAQPILEKRDFIILDEPTNHLDLFAREMLEDTLESYDGTLLIVSHDQYFVRRVCKKALVIEDQKIKKLEYLPC